MVGNLQLFSVGWSFGQPFECLVDLLVWFVEWLVCRLVGPPVSWLVRLSVCWSICLSVGQPVGWLVGWSIG
jgi:hypothetical protein